MQVSETLESELGPIELCAVPGVEAMEVWRKLAADHAGRAIPIILGDDDTVEQMREEQFEDLAGGALGPAGQLKAAGEVDLAAQWAGWREERDPESAAGFSDGEDPEPVEDEEAPFAAVEDRMSGEFAERVTIALLATPNAWEAPARLCGSAPVNYGIDPSAQCAVHRDWEGRYGARIAAMTVDTIECVVDRPPTTIEEARRLAEEMYLYCPDIIEQGVADVETLARSLVGARRWFFWWD